MDTAVRGMSLIYSVVGVCAVVRFCSAPVRVLCVCRDRPEEGGPGRCRRVSPRSRPAPPCVFEQYHSEFQIHSSGIQLYIVPLSYPVSRQCIHLPLDTGTYMYMYNSRTVQYRYEHRAG